MERILIIGSGASGVHFALSVLRKDYDVVMLDVGYKKHPVINPQDCFNDLKSNLAEPAEYFLGEKFQAVIYPDFEPEYYGFPPSKDYVFANVPNNSIQPQGFAPLFSFAQGGLAEAWTAGVYPFNDDDLKDFPFSYRDIEPYYDEVSDRIGIAGLRDDLAHFFPFHRHLISPLDLDDHSKLLLKDYAQYSDLLNTKFNFFLGRSRIAALSQDKDGRKSCNYDGRCLWGCPSEALYTPSVTLKECLRYSTFTYIPGMYVTHFTLNSKNTIKSVIAETSKSKSTEEFHLDKLILAAGTLSSSRIFLNSILHNYEELIKLEGLMDNRQILVPFLNLKMIGKKYNPNTYQYHQIAFVITDRNPGDYIHGLITTLKTALIHPIIQSIPFDLKSSIFLFRNVHAALGILNINFPDQRRSINHVSLEVGPESAQPKLIINYIPGPNEKNFIKKTIKKVKRALWKLGCVVPPGVIHIRPMGASVHYAGTIPMSTERISYTVSEYCQSHDFDNLYIVDGTTFPFLPAKNLSFTLMANAVRVAESAF